MNANYLSALGAILLLVGCRERDQSRSSNGPVPEEYGAAGAAISPGRTLDSDTALNQKIRDSLSGLLTNQQTNDLVIASHAGIVTLKGRVGTTSLKQDISRSIKQTDGVTDVRNQLEVDPAADITLERNNAARQAEKQK
ncbi:MAG: hypothetical protein JWM04_2459 [Verrucomicrobiales bacterium]|nr:hypothetical protein [Verrucomicrobiales bacterium]